MADEPTGVQVSKSGVPLFRSGIGQVVAAAMLLPLLLLVAAGLLSTPPAFLFHGGKIIWSVAVAGFFLLIACSSVLQKRLINPEYDLQYARRTCWVAGAIGIGIVSYQAWQMIAR